MIKNLILVIIVIGVAATLAYNMGWLSSDGEDTYEKVEETVKDAMDR